MSAFRTLQIMEKALKIDHLCVRIHDRVVLNDINLNVGSGELHALMGPNGTGKTTLAKALVGHPDAKIEAGTITVDGKSIVGAQPDVIARAGLFLAFQYPCAVPGVSVANFIRAALAAKLPKDQRFDAPAYYKKLYATMEMLGIDRSFSGRSLNDGFSGGEKKRCEVLQLCMIAPKYVILDELDSGLDVDALRVVAEGIKTLRRNGTGCLVITHYQKFLEYLEPSHVHILGNGTIARSGDATLAQQLEIQGFAGLKASA